VRSEQQSQQWTEQLVGFAHTLETAKMLAGSAPDEMMFGTGEGPCDKYLGTSRGNQPLQNG